VDCGISQPFGDESSQFKKSSTSPGFAELDHLRFSILGLTALSGVNPVTNDGSGQGN
jgi:hypothetical protein